jgi:anti-sigma regulatory factor (Ser/Thr protein kinase)
VLRFANAGHLPPIVVTPGGACEVVSGQENPPLGVGPFNLTQHEVDLSSNTRVVLYTDGLVERRGEDLELGIKTLGERLSDLEGPVESVPEELASAMLPDGPDDDVAILIARVDPPTAQDSLSRRLEAENTAVANARHLVTTYLAERSMPPGVVTEAALATSELVTNALLHGRPPVDFRLRVEGGEVLIEVRDRATYQPRKQRPDELDEHGRGLQIVSAVSSRWGTRPTEQGKAVWCVLRTGV